MELILCARHQVTGYCEEHQLINKWLFQIDLNMLIWKYSLALYKQRAHLWLSNYVPPVLAVLDHILNHLIVVTFEFIVLLIGEQPQILDAIVESKHFEIFIYLLKNLLYLKNFLNVYFYVLGTTRLILRLASFLLILFCTIVLIVVRLARCLLIYWCFFEFFCLHVQVLFGSRWRLFLYLRIVWFFRKWLVLVYTLL